MGFWGWEIDRTGSESMVDFNIGSVEPFHFTTVELRSYLEKSIFILLLTWLGSIIFHKIEKIKSLNSFSNNDMFLLPIVLIVYWINSNKCMA